MSYRDPDEAAALRERELEQRLAALDDEAAELRARAELLRGKRRPWGVVAATAVIVLTVVWLATR